MNDGFAAFAAAAGVCLMIVGLVIAGIAIERGQSTRHSVLIERGLAEYCPTTGDFAFIGECE